ncbi:hypothetical protein EOM39_07680 [Candidatus Gracilibacteria bacterium]|nr:hypothetical protein [Candidatus Gracilibacteria bacterium]
MNDLEIFRTEIDEIDKKLIDNLSMRFMLAQKIGKYKDEHNMPPFQPERWQQVIKSRKSYGLEKGIEERFIEEMWDVIHKYSLEMEIIGKS